MPSGILAAIIERTLADVRSRAGRASRRELEDRAAARAFSRLGFAPALRRPEAEPIRLIAEIKKASPSKGVLAPDLDAGRLAGIYRESGADAISVVTEPHFFLGDEGFLAAARASAPDRPLLRKDFHVHELQILEAAAGEADAILLIAGVLSPMQLRDYLDIADAFRLGHLVEVGTRGEAEIALKAGAAVIGVNHRDLATFRVDPDRMLPVLPLLREADAVSVGESGIKDRGTVLRFEELGVHALLVGEALVSAGDPGARLRELRGESGASAGEPSP